MKKYNLIWLAGLISLNLVFTGCEKLQGDKNPAVVNNAEDDAIADELYNNVYDEMDEITLGDRSKSTETDSNRVITWVENQDGTRDITVVYNNWNNPRSKRNRVINGILNIHEEGYYFDNSYIRTVTMENLFINGIQIKGTQVVEKITNYTFSIVLTDGQLIFPDGTIYTRNAEYVFTIAEGTGTPLNIWDDVYETSGEANGIDRLGRAYTFEIITPLVKNMQWRYLVEGIIKITVGEEEALLDFGDGSFDNLASVTYQGEVYIIELKR